MIHNTLYRIYGCADKNPYRHDRRADKDSYSHDRRVESQCRMPYEENPPVMIARLVLSPYTYIGIGTG